MSDNDSYVFVVSNTSEQQAVLVDVARQILNRWQIHIVNNEEDAFNAIEDLKHYIKVAMVDLYLIPENRQDMNGIKVIKQLRKQIPKCIIILTSMFHNDRLKMHEALRVEAPGIIDEMVSLRHIDTDPIAELQSALFKARRQVDAGLLTFPNG